MPGAPILLEVNTQIHAWLHSPGFLVHLGDTLLGGHYFAGVKCPDGTWVKADDEEVKTVRFGTSSPS